jgi:hypothetical protein
VTFIELLNSLPNGFHDATIETVALDYVHHEARLRLSLWTATEDDPDPERYELAELVLTGMLYFVVESGELSDREGVWIDAGAYDEAKAPAPPAAFAALPAGAFSCWIFAHHWNSFIHIAAMNASLRMLAE